MTVKRTILAVEDEAGAVRRAVGTCSDAEWTSVFVASIPEAELRIADGHPDVLITGLGSNASEALKSLRRLRRRHLKTKIIVIAATVSPDVVLQSLKAHAFSYFAVPFSDDEVRDTIKRALEEPDWNDGIEVLSDKPDWVAVRARCRQLTADRLLRFFDELSADISEADRESMGSAFREILMNAIEHGGRFDPEQTVDITRIRTDRLIIYLVQDPGPGFDFSKLPHAAVSSPDDPVRHVIYRDEHGLRAGGFGLLVAGGLVDEVLHNSAGNQAILIKHLHDVPDTKAVDAA